MHNERIDQKILHELTRSHVVVSDLTFARPSVYWEAGYAEGQRLPVVYTCRRDHFKYRSGDDFGNFKVHFDLQMKNIIQWDSEKDTRFSAQLEKRLQYVCRPLFREQQQTRERERAETAFQSLSVDTRRRRVVDIAIKEAQKLRVQAVMQTADWDDVRFHPRWALVGKYRAKLNFTQKGTPNVLLVIVLQNLTKSYFLEIATQLARPLDMVEAKKAYSKRRIMVDHAIIVSFAPVSKDLVGHTLHSFQREAIGSTSAWWHETTDVLSSGKRRVWFYTISNIRSETQAGEQIRTLLSQIRASA